MPLLLHARGALGRAIGRTWAPLVATLTRLRHSRMFHPEGVVVRGTVEPIDGPHAALGRRLAGPVLARFSAALWKGEPRWYDVLGVALRFHDAQDLLLATIRSPFVMALSPIATRTRDFLANRYWAVSVFAVDGARLKFRLRPEHAVALAGDRDQRLRQAVRAGRCTWLLEARGVFHRTYRPVARIALDRLAPEVDQEALRFDPFHAELGVVPDSLVHAIRPAVYGRGQRARAAAHDR